MLPDTSVDETKQIIFHLEFLPMMNPYLLPSTTLKIYILNWESMCIVFKDLLEAMYEVIS